MPPRAARNDAACDAAAPLHTCRPDLDTHVCGTCKALVNWKPYGSFYVRSPFMN